MTARPGLLPRGARGDAAPRAGAASPFRPRRAARALVALCLGLLALAGSARGALSAQLEIPRNDGWVTDLAGLLSPAKESELEALMESYRQGTTHEIAVLTVASLEGRPVERFALEVGRAWGMGTKEKNNAALLVVAKEDRAVRIEVARGLEGSLTDSISGRIIRDVIVPQFKKGRFEEGIEAGVRAMHAAIGGEYRALPRRSAPEDSGLVGCLVPALFVLFVLLSAIARRRGGRRRRSVFFPFPIGGFPTSHGGFGGFPHIGGGGGGGGGFGGFGGGGGFSGGGASGRW